MHFVNAVSHPISAHVSVVFIFLSLFVLFKLFLLWLFFCFCCFFFCFVFLHLVLKCIAFDTKIIILFFVGLVCETRKFL